MALIQQLPMGASQRFLEGIKETVCYRPADEKPCDRYQVPFVPDIFFNGRLAPSSARRTGRFVPRWTALLECALVQASCNRI